MTSEEIQFYGSLFVYLCSLGALFVWVAYGCPGFKKKKIMTEDEYELYFRTNIMGMTPSTLRDPIRENVTQQGD
jgi:hypothetical protein